MDENRNEKPTGKPAASPLNRDSIAHELTHARKILGWTQMELHQRTGISRETIKQYETGRNLPGAREIRLLSAALKISPNRLLLGTDEFVTPASPLGGLINAENNPINADSFRSYMQFMGIYSFLLPAERAAILTLIEPLLLSRKEADEVKTMLDMMGEMADAVRPIMEGMQEKMQQIPEGEKKAEGS
jgi:transcriptional regulator with XRE-family HTH domain